MSLSDGDRSRLASGFNAVIPAQAGIQGFLDSQAKISMAPSSLSDLTSKGRRRGASEKKNAPRWCKKCSFDV
jgi:hypothetical protein